MDIRIADCPLGAKCEEVKVENGKTVLLRCPWYVEVKGYDSNRGVETQNWGCAIAWMPVLIIDAANATRQSGAATESFRNEMVKQNARGALDNGQKEILHESNSHQK